MTRDSTGWAAVSFWTPPAWDLGFFAKCALARLTIVLGPAALLMSVRQGLLALAISSLLSLWPRARWLRASTEGLRVRYLIVETMIPTADIERASLERDPRRWVLGKRETVLRVQRRRGSTLLIFARPETLRRLCEALVAG